MQLNFGVISKSGLKEDYGLGLDTPDAHWFFDCPGSAIWLYQMRKLQHLC